MTYETREEWLRAAERVMRHWIEIEGYTYPDNTRVSCGFPRKGKGRGDPIGQCWSYIVSGDETFEMFICPTQGDPGEVAHILLHEMCHATVGLENGHNKVFGKLARALGFEGKLTATVPDSDLRALIKAQVLDILGPYPHAQMTLRKGSTTPKAKTYLIKLVCPECEYPAYTTQKWLDSDGAPLCPSCDGQPQLERK